MAKCQRSYSEDDKASALALLDSNGGNVFRTAKLLNMPRATLQEWRDGRGINSEVTTSRQVKKGELSARYESAVHELLDALSRKIARASLKDIAWAAGVFTDKMRALDGEVEPYPFAGLPPLTPEQQRRIERLRAVRDAATPEDELEEAGGVQ
jgi:transposase-like protein